MKKLLIVIVVIVPILAVFWIGSRVLGSTCGEQVVSEETSPDGRYVAVWMRRNCGATTAFADHINMRMADQKFQASYWDGTMKKNEVFILDTSYARLTRLQWEGSRKLVVEYSGSVGNLPRANSWKDISIDYRH